MIPALTFTPVLEDGMFIGDSGQSFIGGNVSTMYRPKTIEISLTFNPLHDFNMGFDELGSVKGEFAGFPYDSKIEQPPSEGIGVLTSEEFNRRQALGAIDQLGDLFGSGVKSGYEQAVTDDILGIS